MSSGGLNHMLGESQKIIIGSNQIVMIELKCLLIGTISITLTLFGSTIKL